MQEIEFWFSIGSTYTYLTVLRMNQIQRDHGIELKLRPFSVRNIMRQMDNVPFPPSKKSKVDYMWRDIERRSIRYGFPAKVPVPYPLKEFDLANKLAILGVQEGWCASHFTTANDQRIVQQTSLPEIIEQCRETLVKSR